MRQKLRTAQMQQNHEVRLKQIKTDTASNNNNRRQPHPQTATGSVMGFGHLISANASDAGGATLLSPNNNNNNQDYRFRTKIIDLLDPHIDFVAGLDQQSIAGDKQARSKAGGGGGGPLSSDQQVVSEVSTTFSEVSNVEDRGANLLKRLRQAETNKNGR